MEEQRHVVLGAGQIGPRVAQRLLAAGHRVRIVRRSPREDFAHPSLTWVHGDLRDPDFAARAIEGAAVVYDCMNPRYDRWRTELLPLACGALHGAERAGAKLVALDCLYMYGRVDGPMREDTPMRPCSVKGRLRKTLAERRLAADVEVAIGRASDFIGPGLDQAVFAERMFERILAGKAAECTGDPAMPHAYTYVEDVARGLVDLGTSDATGVWHLPTNPARPTEALVAELGAALGVEADTKRVPGYVLSAVGLFMPVLRELVEMAYQWEMPFEVDDGAFVARFGWSATPYAAIVEMTSAWARERFGVRAPAIAAPRPL